MIVFLMLLIGPALFMLAAWAVMLLIDPATAGAYTVSYGQARAITASLGMFGGGSSYRKDR